ncbi:MAG: cellulase family glycosylhydrolase [Candidatus Nanopelagicales bacterium]
MSVFHRVVRWISATALACAVLALPVGPASAGTGLPPLPLRTSGNQIVDANGSPVVLQGVNWFGLETANHAPHGLWTRDYKEMLAQIKSLGFNTIRLPFSLQALRSTSTSGIDYGGGRNAALQGKTPQQVMDAIIAEAAAQGLMIILDNHSQADDGYMYDLWYGQNGFTEDDWVTTWTDLAKRYKDTPNVVGFDLKNEPHGSATWGTGAATDWRRAAERAGNAVLAQAPTKLVLVEGIEGQVAGGQLLDRHWWGGNLEGVRSNPVRLNVANRLVYSPHEYGPGVYNQPWFSDPNMASILADRWTKGFGYIHDNGLAPILVGEFGAKNVGTDTVEGRWIRQFADYLGRKGMNWTFWAWNPNSGDTGGVLTDDWRTVNTAKMDLLTALIQRRAIDYGPGPTPSGTPTPSPTASGSPRPTTSPSPTPSSSPTGTGSVTATLTTDSTWSGGWCGKWSVANGRSQRIVIDRLGARLPSTAAVTSVWNGTVSRSGNSVTVTPPSWAGADPGRTYTDTGICVTGTAPTLASATWHDSGGSGSSSPTPSTTPSSTPTPTPTTPSPSPTPTGNAATVTAAPASATANGSIAISTSWAGGDCRTLTVKNTGTVAITGYSSTFSLPTNTTITSSWNGTVTRSGTTVTVTPASWATSIPAGTSRADFGFCTTHP